ncbi:ATP-binding protein [Streptomyces xiamenensis]|uniref:ATP-binding protein n=1 Tax=Streptomyces xiamenensis TaxID=408015 RepID=UPI0035E01EBE
MIEGLVKQVRGEAMLLSLCPTSDPASVAERMIAGVDLEAAGRYAAVVDRLLDELEQVELTGRSDWLAVPLPATPWQMVRDGLAAARAEVTARLGLLPAPVSAGEERQALAAAARLASSWPAGLRIRPAREAEILWMVGHAQRRGAGDAALPGRAQPRLGRGRSAAVLEEAVLREGGLRGPAQEGRGRVKAGVDVFRQRWLEVATEHGASYQSLLVLAEMPAAFRWPGSEYLQVVDACDFGVDYVVRLNVVPRVRARRGVQRQANELAYQAGQHEASPTGAPDSLSTADAELREYDQRLSASQTEVEVQVMVAMCVWGNSAREADDRARALTAMLAEGEYQLARPVGQQEALWYGMLPGTRTPAVMGRYRQYQLAADFAMSGPWAGNELGDSAGPLLGLQTTSGGVRPVLCDLGMAPRRQQSASAAYVGELGSGKTFGMKTAVFNVLASGRRSGVPGSRGRAVIVDRTERREWAAFARSCPGETQTVVIGPDAGFSLDPLRMFCDLAEAQRRAETFLAILLGVPSSGELASALSEGIAAVLAAPGPSLPRLMAHLQDAGGADAAARALGRSLAAVARRDLTQRLLFDGSLPALAVGDADSVVFAVSSLELPMPEDLASGREHLSAEKILGQAVMYLVTALCRQVCMADRNEFAVAVWDECWWVASIPEGLRLLVELIRDGRKHNAGVLLGTHDADDILQVSAQLGRVALGLIPRRFLFRHSSKELAEKGLRFLGLPVTEDLVQLVTTGLSPTNLPAAEAEVRAGECLHRDLAGRIGTMKILAPVGDPVVPALYSEPDSGTSVEGAG